MIARAIAAVLLAAVLTAGDARAQEQAFTNRATELRDRPAFEAKAIAQLPDNTAVKVIARQSGWTQVEANQQKGWVRVFHLRFPSTVETSSSSGGGLSGLSSMFGFGSRKAPETSKVATIGIRGLTPEDFKNASPDPGALRKMQSWRSDRAGAERFAKEAKLVPVNVAYADEGGRR
jgi:uncharacterized protein YgiM (DUF1202 family)